MKLLGLCNMYLLEEWEEDHSIACRIVIHELSRRQGPNNYSDDEAKCLD